MKNFILVLIGMIFMNQGAYAGKISLVGAYDLGLSKDTVTAFGTATVKSTGIGGGILVELGVFETGAIYVSQSVTVTFAGISTPSTGSAIQIPLMYRFGHVVSFGIGGFYDLGMGTNATSSYGLAVGPRIMLGSSLFIDARFDYNLKSGVGSDVLALLGYQFGK